MAQPARRTAGRARNSSVLEVLTRGGFVGYGLLHLAVGWLALQIAFGRATQEGSRSGAFRLAHQPLGRPLLVVVAVGLLAMAMWQALEAAVGHHAETGGRRVAERIFSAARAVVYAVLAWTAFQVQAGAPTSSAGQQEQATAGVLAHPAGRVLVVLGAAPVKKEAARSTGLDGALHTLAGKPYGQVLLVGVAAGFGALGVYCFFQSRYRRV